MMLDDCSAEIAKADVFVSMNDKENNIKTVLNIFITLEYHQIIYLLFNANDSILRYLENYMQIS
jgi:hypothetical protein